jgi:hypothetical protein
MIAFAGHERLVAGERHTGVVARARWPLAELAPPGEGFRA